MPIARTLVLLVAVLLAACGADDRAPERELRLAAAASLKPCVAELAAAFERERPGVRATTTFGSSGVLAGQILNRAPFDVFLSADAEYPRRLVERGAAAEARTFAMGTLVAWARRDRGLDLAAHGAEGLGGNRVRHVAIANPKHAPYGRAAVELLSALGLKERTEARLVLGENAEQAAQFAFAGAADAALIPRSLAMTPEMARVGEVWTPPADLCPPVAHAAAAIAWAADPELARAFVEFLASPAARSILESHGLAPVGEPE